MRAADLAGRRVAVWGLGREGRATLSFLRRHNPRMPLIVLDDDPNIEPPDEIAPPIVCALGREAIARALERIEIVVKSPGVSLYRREIIAAREKGVKITSLINLWFAETSACRTICVTGSKGKSTTASLIAQILGKLGRRVALAGNIGRAVSEIDAAAEDAVIEVSSYQAADFDGICDVAVLTALFPEHLDWHGSLDAYYRDKLNLLAHSRLALVTRDTAAAVDRLAPRSLPEVRRFADAGAIHARDRTIFDGASSLGVVENAYLARPHNLANLCAALSVAKALGLDPAAALAAASDFRGLPHRQQELGEIGGVLYVDDSISTTPESTIAALEVYAGRCITVIVGGHDRGIDYQGLVESFAGGAASGVVCLGGSGRRIHAMMRRALAANSGHGCALHRAGTMARAVAAARRMTPPGGVVLLSPAAPSYGQYRDFVERGRDFAAAAGLSGS